MKKILILDDQLLNITVLEAFLNRYDPTAEIHTSLQTKEAMQLCEKHNFDIIFTDIVMPETDGLEFSSWVRGKKGKSTTIIACTANSENTLEDCEDAGIDYLVYKPFQFEDIKEILSFL